jgi:TRAP-type C4-dicarboxylate transport system permease small subunit
MYRMIDRAAHGVAHRLALPAGAVLNALGVLTSVSIIGRALVGLDIGLRPIRGIYDMTEIGMAIAIFAFLPLAQIQDAHARVDLFKPAFPGRVNRLLDLVFDMAMAAVAVIGTWRLYLGMQDKIAFGETTLIAQIPVWWGYAAGLVGAAGFVFVAFFCVLRAARGIVVASPERTGRVEH